MDANLFKNGLLGHRVEGKLSGYPDRIQGIWVGMERVDGDDWDRIVADDGYVRLVTDLRVLLPEREDSGPHKPDQHPSLAVTRTETHSAKPYSLESQKEVMRLTDEVLIPAGFSDFVSRTSMYCKDKIEWVIATKDDSRIMIDATGVSLIMPSGATVYGIYIPLSEWVKNPTIESLMPPKQD